MAKALKEVLIELFGSKKFLALLAAIVLWLAGRFGLQIDPASLDRLLGLFAIYIGAQGVADFGKGKAELEAKTKAANDNAPIADKAERGAA